VHICYTLCDVTLCETRFAARLRVQRVADALDPPFFGMFSKEAALYIRSLGGVHDNYA